MKTAKKDCKKEQIQGQKMSEKNYGRNLCQIKSKKKPWKLKEYGKTTTKYI